MTYRWKWGKLPECEIKNSQIRTNWNKTAKALKTIAGVDVLDSTGQVKDMNEILGELGEKYKDLDKNSRLALGEAIGGNWIIFH